MFVTDAAIEPPVKRGRGRPRKIVPEGGFPPKVPSWIAWAQSVDEPEDAQEVVNALEVATPAAVSAPVSPRVEAPVVPLVRALERMTRPTGLRAGTRWTRRLRGFVALSKKHGLGR